ncbi:MAG: hypothetical protein BGO69_13140 [Bacteroidetes bacterium 46-16]|nr:MAG: hypothetical protein BGO69_13140 [Bacteroidetes bacterium 46-16]
MKSNYNIWWGPPKKFTTEHEERKISWLELFYDLVYVIVISRITHHLAVHPDVGGIINYVYLFAMIYWGWFNGSEYHDLHGSPGIRTRFMTLWQMMAVAALAVTLDSPPELFIARTTICFSFLQGFITYLWWSVGIYDKNHRRLSVPYVTCYFGAFIMLITSLYIPAGYKPVLFTIILLVNYLPPFLNHRRLQASNSDFSLSMSMVERLGLFTIIIFGENILGVVNGIAALNNINTATWLCFGLGILIVFALWWIFFALIADRECRHGFLMGQTFIFLFIPTLASLGMVGATFSVLFAATQQANEHIQFVRNIWATGIGVFLLSVLGTTKMLIYPSDYDRSKKLLQRTLLTASITIMLLTSVSGDIPLQYLMLLVFTILMIIIILITRSWFVIQLKLIAGEEHSEHV